LLINGLGLITFIGIDMLNFKCKKRFEFLCNWYYDTSWYAIFFVTVIGADMHN
jgi:hypothetical protein